MPQLDDSLSADNSDRSFDRPDRPPERLVEIVRGFMGTQLLHAATRLGIPDELQKSPRSALELSEITGTDNVCLSRMLNGLVALDALGIDDDGRFLSTPLFSLLRSDASDSFRDALLLYGDIYYRAWSSLPEAVQTGRNAFPLAFGMSFWDYLSEHPDIAAIFSGAMASNSRREADDVASLIDLSGVDTVIDVGGGNAIFMATLLAAHPMLCGVVFDLPAALAQAEAHLKEVGVHTRCEIVAGDFFSGIPPGGDIYILKAILHNWDDEHAVTLLRNCRRVMQNDTRLCLVERLQSREPATAAQHRARVLADLEMMVLFGGRERSRREIDDLLSVSDLRLMDVKTSRSEFSVIEVIPGAEPPARLLRQS